MPKKKTQITNEQLIVEEKGVFSDNKNFKNTALTSNKAKKNKTIHPSIAKKINL